MSLHYTPYAIPVFVSAFISITLSIWGWRRRNDPGAKWFISFMLGAFIWFFFYGLELSSRSLSQTLLFSKIEYIGVLALVTSWFFLTLIYTGQRRWITPRNAAPLYLIPTITLILAWTNEYHQLLWRSPALSQGAPFNTLTFTPGIWWWINIAYIYGIFVFTAVWLIIALTRSAAFYRRQIIFLLIAAGFTWLGNFLYILHLTPYNIDPSPVTFAINGILVAWGVFRYRIMDLMPISASAIIENMNDGFIALDTQRRIIDINLIAQKIIGKTQAEVIGKPIEATLAAFPNLNSLWKSLRHNTTLDVLLNTPNFGTRSYEIRILETRGRLGRRFGWLVFWHDITQRKRQEAALRLITVIVHEISATPNLSSALHKTLELIVEYTGWIFGEAWIPHETGKYLVNSGVSYYRKEQEALLKPFDEISQTHKVVPNMGLPGRVWISRQPEWQRDISTLGVEIYFRVDYAIKANLKAALGIPVIAGEEVVAVLVFYMDQAREEDKEVIELISTAAKQFGAILRTKHAEEIMRLQSAALEASANGIVITDKDGNITWANPAYSRLTGYEVQEVIGRNPRILKSGKHSQEFYKNLWDTILAGKSWHGEIINRRKDATFYFEEQTITPTRDAEGNITHFIAIKQDVTERKQIEEERRKLARAAEQSGHAIIITDLQGIIEFVNPAFTRITGYTPEEAIGKNVNLLNSGKHPREFYETLWKTITEGKVWHGEILNRRKNGELYWESATISPIFNKKGETTHYLAVKEDISDRKAIEASLRKEQERTDALLRNILPEQVAEEIKRTGKVTPALFEEASILFADFKNFTATAERISPQELIDLVAYYFSAFDDIIEKHHIEKLKTIGDSYMCASGLPQPSKTHAEDIVRAALDILRFVEQEKETRRKQGLRYWDIRIGISSGPVVAGVVGQKKYAYDVWGDTVVMAARMESSGEVGKINISRTTYELIRDKFECKYRGVVSAKHKGEVEMYFVERERI